MTLLATGIGLLTWPLLSYTFPTLFSQISFKHSYEKEHVITPQLSAFIEDTMERDNITGLSIAFVQKSGDAEFYPFGYRTENGDSMTSETLFNMASVSKAFCATAVGLLIDDFAHGNNVTALPPGVTELTWHTRLHDLLPEWQLMDEFAWKRANLRDILSHVSGLPRHDYSYGPSDAPQDVVARLKHLRPAFELRERWSYNNIMYMVAAHVIATYSGQSYTSFVEERIFIPLGMTSSTFSPYKAKASGKYTQGWTKTGRRVPESFTEGTAFNMAGPGGVVSNAVDMTKWISAWINEGVYQNLTVIPSSVYRNVSYSYAVAVDHPPESDYSIVGYGTGWQRTSYRGHDTVSHGGALPWLSTLVAFLPTDEIGVTLFANAEGKAETLKLILNRILDSALDLSAPSNLQSKPSPKVISAEHEAENLTLSLDAFAGTYANPGYGSFVLCGPSNSSSYCTSVRSDFSAVDSVRAGPGPESLDLFAEWPRIWSSHVRLRHQRESIFELCFTSLYPNGWGKDTTPFETWEDGEGEGWVEFVVEGVEVVGFGMGGLLGELTERERKYQTVQERAEVWFDKVL